MSQFNLDQFLPYRVSVLAQRLSREFEGRYRRKFGIQVAEWRIVAHLSHSGPTGVREIVQRVDLHKSRVSRAAGRLQAAGYISKTTDPRDRRMVELKLTAKGEAMMRELAPLADRYQRELMTRAGRDFAAFEKGIQSLIETSE